MKIIVIIGAVVLLLIGLWFYWFQIRREQKLKECVVNAEEVYSETWNSWDDDGDGELPAYKADDLAKYRKDNLDRCLRAWK